MRWPPIGLVGMGRLRRLTPVSRHWGEDRGLPIDRYYIEQFLSSHHEDVHGHVLEFKNDAYTLRFGGERVTRSDVLHKREGNPIATMVGDLTYPETFQPDLFDCVICTQTLQFIYEVKAAVATLYRILKPGGVVLVTIPGITPISRCDMEQWGDYWRFTTLSTRLLFAEVFPPENLEVQAYGNVLAAIAFLHGLAVEELQQSELEYRDRDYECLIAVRARKPGGSV